MVTARCLPSHIHGSRRGKGCPSRPVQVKVASKDPKVVKGDWDSKNGNGTSSSKVPVMMGDYGFRSGASRLYEDQYGEVPANIFSLAMKNFGDEWVNMRRTFVNDEFNEMADANKRSNLVTKAGKFVGDKLVRGFGKLDNALVNVDVLQSLDELDMVAPDAAPSTTARGAEERERLKELTLDSHKVEMREKQRFAANPPTAPWVIKAPYYALCFVLDLVYEGRPIQRFWVLEEVARMPYFAYISMLHLYESLGWWRAGAALRRVHFAEEWNELHHLQIMESLGGDNQWFDRFVAQHSAVIYFWGLLVFYAFSPKNAYAFSELVEGHAADTYDEFCSQNKEKLQKLPPPAVAVEYYQGRDVYMFQTFMTSKESIENPRQPKCENLYDVFINIRDDELEHQKTMVSCQNPEAIAKDIAAAVEARHERCSVD